jgi:hypothetical protein
MMKTSGIVMLLVVVSGGVAAEAQSLGELAQKEKERRATKTKEAKPSGPAPKVVTQEDLDSYAARRPAESESTGEGAATADEAMGSLPRPTSERASGQGPSRSSGGRSPQGIPDDSDERARLEKSWKARAEAARNAVKAAEREREAAQNERNGVGTGPQSGTTWQDGAGRIRGYGGENPGQWTQKANAADARLARARSGLEQAKQGLEKFEEEARRAGIPPGWVR